MLGDGAPTLIVYLGDEMKKGGQDLYYFILKCFVATVKKKNTTKKALGPWGRRQRFVRPTTESPPRPRPHTPTSLLITNSIPRPGYSTVFLFLFDYEYDFVKKVHRSILYSCVSVTKSG